MIIITIIIIIIIIIIIEKVVVIIIVKIKIRVVTLPNGQQIKQINKNNGYKRVGILISVDETKEDDNQKVIY